MSKKKIQPREFTFIKDLIDESVNISRQRTSGGQPRRKRRKNGDNNDNEKEDFYPHTDSSVWMRSCQQEVVEPIEGKVTGEIPIWVRGSLLRNGPGSLHVDKYTFNHLFDSSALVHRFSIHCGKVTYQNRFVKTEAFTRNHEAKRIVMTEFGTEPVPDPCQTIFKWVSAIFHPYNLTDNSMITVYPFGEEYYTFAEMPVIHRIDPNSLDTITKVDISSYVNIVSHTSHPHVMTDGSVYNIGLSITKTGPKYSVMKFPASPNEETKFKQPKASMFDRAKIVASTSPRWFLHPSYMHTFGITENYFVIVEQPLAISLISTANSILRNKPLASCLKWQENETTQIRLISRKNGKLVKTFIAEGFFFLHIINQYETRDKNYVVLDICCYHDAKMLDCMYVEAMKNMHKNPDYSKLFCGRPLRFVLPTGDFAANAPANSNLVNYDSLLIEEVCLADVFPVFNAKYGKLKLETRTDLQSFKATAYKLKNRRIFVKPELICNVGCETPRINYEKCLGKEYRYFYAISSEVDTEVPGLIIKVDILRKTKITWSEKNVYPSEPVFVPHPGGQNEDDGVILSALVWGEDEKNKVGLVVLKASTFEELARVDFQTPGPVPKCLHGWFVKEKKNTDQNNLYSV